jgi:hypothetical protein
VGFGSASRCLQPAGRRLSRRSCESNEGGPPAGFGSAS